MKRLFRTEGGAVSTVERIKIHSTTLEGDAVDCDVTVFLPPSGTGDRQEALNFQCQEPALIARFTPMSLRYIRQVAEIHRAQSATCQMVKAR